MIKLFSKLSFSRNKLKTLLHTRIIRSRARFVTQHVLLRIEDFRIEDNDINIFI